MESLLFRPLHTAACRTQCSHCNLREICLPLGLTREELEHIDARMVGSRRKLGRGETLFRAGDRLEALFAIWTGFFKTVILSDQGREQVTGFHMGGELLGLGGIDTGVHEVDAIALEDSQVCVIAFDQLATLCREFPSLQHQFSRIMSHEIAGDHTTMLMLGSMHAEERLAAFLLNLVHRLQVRGFSATSLLLRMSREEIGSFLGLKLETVSRTFSKFQQTGLLDVRQRQIEIVDAAGLQQILDGAA